MKKIMSVLVLAALSLTMMFGLAGCGGEVTLAAKTIEGISIDMPSDFGEFTDQSGMQLAANEDQTATITVSATADGQGIKPTDFSQEDYRQQIFPGKNNVEFVKFDNASDCNGIPAIFSECKMKNSSDVSVTTNTYILFHEDGKIQTVNIAYNTEEDSSAKANIDAILKSIKASA